jgi:ketosteroid isomerase-like protein
VRPVCEAVCEAGASPHIPQLPLVGLLRRNQQVHAIRTCPDVAREKPMNDFQAIADRVEIEALRGDYADAVMMGDRARLATLFAPDGVLRMPNVPVELVGREEIRTWGEQVQDAFDYFIQTTHPGMIQIDGDTASGRAYLQELIRLKDGRSNVNFAIYHDRYQRTADGWKFTERVYEVRYVDTTALAGSAPGGQSRS